MDGRRLAGTAITLLNGEDWARSGPAVWARLAPEYWIARVDGLSATLGRLWFEGFLQQMAAFTEAKTPITNLQPLFPTLETMLPKIRRNQRLPFLAMYFIYNRLLPVEHRSASADVILKTYEGELAMPSLECGFRRKPAGATDLMSAAIPN